MPCDTGRQTCHIRGESFGDLFGTHIVRHVDVRALKDLLVDSETSLLVFDGHYLYWSVDDCFGTNYLVLIPN